MAVSQRLRFEILRRDSHTCRYCGAQAPGIRLTVDHVIPTALGGPDTPDNLTTACEDCNSGKSSVPAEAPVVAAVRQDAERWARAMRQAAEEAEQDHRARHEYRTVFAEAWAAHPATRNAKLPTTWGKSVDALGAAGLPGWALADSVETAAAQAERRKITIDSVFRYTCGVAWKKAKALSDRALQLVGSESPAHSRDGYDHNTAYTALCDIARFLEGSRCTEVPEHTVDARETAALFAVMLAATSIDCYVEEGTIRKSAPPPVPNLNRPWWAHFMAGHGRPDLEAWHEEVLDLGEQPDDEQDPARWVTLDARPHSCTMAEELSYGWWREVAGEEIAKEVTPVCFNEETGILHLHAPKRAWATQIKRLAEQLIARLDCEPEAPKVISLLFTVKP